MNIYLLSRYVRLRFFPISVDALFPTIDAHFLLVLKYSVCLRIFSVVLIFELVFKYLECYEYFLLCCYFTIVNACM